MVSHFPNKMRNKPRTKTACVLPWIHLHTWPNGDVYPCCLTPMEDSVGNLNQEKLDDLMNSEKMKNLRKVMMQEKRPESCKRCYIAEDSGMVSFREDANASYNKHIPLMDLTEDDGSIKNTELRYWDFRFSNICNFKCRSCGPQLSTGWYTDTKKMSKKLTGRAFLPDDVPLVNEYDLWEQIQPHFDNVEAIYFAGGEPLIMEEHYRILMRLDEMKKYDTILKYNTNFSEMRYKDLHVLDFWPKFDDVSVGASLDGMYEIGELVRSGFNWNKFVENRSKMKEKCPGVGFYISCTVSVQNIFHITDFHNKLVELKLIDDHKFFHLNVLQTPEELSVHILPDHLKEKAIAKLSRQIELLSGMEADKRFLVDAYTGLIKFIRSKSTTNLIPKFVEKMNMLDEFRDENFAEVVPELKELF